MKVLIYMTLCGTTDDDATQKKGLVYILYWMGDFRTSNNDKDDQDLIISKEALLSHKWLPVRPAFVHLCFNDPVIAVLERMFMHITPRHLRSIFSTHRGRHNPQEEHSWSMTIMVYFYRHLSPVLLLSTTLFAVSSFSVF